MTSNDTFINALIGAVVTIVVSFVPLSPVVGGGVAAYLQGGDTDGGIRVGLLSGVIAVVPMVLVTFFVLSFLTFGGMPGGFVLLLFFILGFALLYVVGLSALGGYLGAYLRAER